MILISHHHHIHIHSHITFLYVHAQPYTVYIKNRWRFSSPFKTNSFIPPGPPRRRLQAKASKRHPRPPPSTRLPLPLWRKLRPGTLPKGRAAAPDHPLALHRRPPIRPLQEPRQDPKPLLRLQRRLPEKGPAAQLGADAQPGPAKAQHPRPGQHLWRGGKVRLQPRCGYRLSVSGDCPESAWPQPPRPHDHWCHCS